MSLQNIILDTHWDLTRIFKVKGQHRGGLLDVFRQWEQMRFWKHTDCGVNGVGALNFWSHVSWVWQDWAVQSKSWSWRYGNQAMHISHLLRVILHFFKILSLCILLYYCEHIVRCANLANLRTRLAEPFRPRVISGGGDGTGLGSKKIPGFRGCVFQLFFPLGKSSKDVTWLSRVWNLEAFFDWCHALWPCVDSSILSASVCWLCMVLPRRLQENLFCNSFSCFCLKISDESKWLELFKRACSGGFIAARQCQSCLMSWRLSTQVLCDFHDLPSFEGAEA